MTRPTTPAERAERLRPLLELASKEVGLLPVDQQIALYDAVGVAAHECNKAVSDAAFAAANALRDVESLQLTFTALIQGGKRDIMSLGQEVKR